MIGARFDTIDMMVSGINFVTEYWIMFVVVPVNVLTTSEPAWSRVTESHVSRFKCTFIWMAMSAMPKTDLMKSIGKAFKFSSRL